MTDPYIPLWQRITVELARVNAEYDARTTGDPMTPENAGPVFFAAVAAAKRHRDELGSCDCPTCRNYARYIEYDDYPEPTRSRLHALDQHATIALAADEPF